MKIINRKNASRLIGLQIALTIAVVLTQMTMLFFHNYHMVFIEKKEGSWKDIAMTAQGEMSACQIDLQAAIDGKQTAILANNPDLK